MAAFWTVAKTKPNQDQIAIRNLKNQDFEYYQPKTIERKLIKNRITNSVIPLFPSYLFVRVCDRWAPLNSTNGLSRVLMCGPIPAVVNDKIIEGLRQREQNGIIRLPKQRFREGDKVTIQAGPFAGQQGLVERMTNKERERVLLALLSGNIKVLIDEENLEAA